MLAKRHYFLFFLILIHNTLLDLFYIGYNGPVFLWEKNLKFEVFTTHFTIATATMLVYISAAKLRKEVKSGKLKIGEKILMICSLFLAAAIVFVIF